MLLPASSMDTLKITLERGGKTGDRVLSHADAAHPAQPRRQRRRAHSRRGEGLGNRGHEK
jgi:hypothetical protein